MASASARPATATLYVILGSHACRTGMLLLEHKGIPYRKVEIPTGLQPFAIKLLGFPGRTERKLDGGRAGGSLKLASRLGTVPALRIDGERVQTNRAIARHLDRIRPDPPLFPPDAGLRGEVEAAERWGDQIFQMAARRLAIVPAFTDPETIRAAGEGRLGPLLHRNDAVRVALVRAVGRFTFDATGRNSRELEAELPAMLDRIDGWIEAGVLNSEQLNAADYMIVTSLALLCYREDLEHEIGSRPAGALTDRVLPAPV